MTRLFIIFLSLFYVTLHGQTDNTKVEHPIDIRLEQCHAVDSNQTTYGMMNCEAIARDEWDKEMNKYYKLLMDTLPSDEKVKLKAAQIAWVNYRDKEKEFSTTMHYNMLGTMWRVVAAGRSCNIVRQRALELESYYDNFTFK
jgi:uncharacterized protein YecT (DUF1311 family)